jgi:hypothetical protein
MQIDNEKGTLSFELPLDVVDELIVITLKQSRGYMVDELNNHYTNGTYMHKDDVSNHHDMISAMSKVIRYFSVDDSNDIPAFFPTNGNGE